MSDYGLNSVVVRSWIELQEELFRGSYNESLGRFRSREAYRGVSSCHYPLQTTLERLGGPYVDLEKHLLRNFRKYAHMKVVERDSIWHWLSVAQHYGLPTRILDWSYSPLVAAHFATDSLDKYDRDGAIWAVNYDRAHAMLPRPLKNKLEEEGANILTAGMLSEEVESLKVLESLHDAPFCAFFEPPSIDERIVNQHACCSFMSTASLSMEDWLSDKPDLWRKIIIPAELKWEIRSKLDQAACNERTYFPGLDGLSKWLARHYSPKK